MDLHFCELIHRHRIIWKNDSKEIGQRSSEIPSMTNLIEMLSHLKILTLHAPEFIVIDVFVYVGDLCSPDVERCGRH